MATTERETTVEERKYIMIDDEKYYIDEMNDTQKNMVFHIDDLTGKITNFELALAQHQMSKQAFVNALKESYSVKDVKTLSDLDEQIDNEGCDPSYLAAKQEANETQ